mmetsp:Transcript_61153/g.172386  ORF Transcript_61153/g.172386 Transcript_61153/m.172386 type:complete len:218 (+) Transcript_61153:1743-2396(+)
MAELLLPAVGVPKDDLVDELVVLDDHCSELHDPRRGRRRRDRLLLHTADRAAEIPLPLDAADLPARLRGLVEDSGLHFMHIPAERRGPSDLASLAGLDCLEIDCLEVFVSFCALDSGQVLAVCEHERRHRISTVRTRLLRGAVGEVEDQLVDVVAHADGYCQEPAAGIGGVLRPPGRRRVGLRSLLLLLRLARRLRLRGLAPDCKRRLLPLRTINVW